MLNKEFLTVRNENMIRLSNTENSKQIIKANATHINRVSRVNNRQEKREFQDSC